VERIVTTSILIADDHPFILAGLEAVLRDSEFKVVRAVADGLAALQALPDCRAKILVLDVAMPGLSGIEVLRRLREQKKAVKVVLLTASIDRQEVAEAIALGVDGIVLKEGAERLLIDCLTAVRDGSRWLHPDLVERVEQLGEEADPLAGLASRERAVVDLLKTGMRNREIATELGMTEGTVKVYLHRIYDKLGVSNRTELAMLGQPENVGRR
jgi:two-component system nitrate/nitrite response regulator NarP